MSDWKNIINFAGISRMLTINNDRGKIRADYLEGNHDLHKKEVELLKLKINEWFNEISSSL